MTRIGRNGRFVFVGNHPCLDFVNTQLIRHGRPVDLLEKCSDLIAWLEQAGVLAAGDARTALRRWGASAEGRPAFEQAQAYRAELRAMVERIVAGKPVPESVVKATNRLLRLRTGWPQLVRTRRGFERTYRAGCAEAGSLLGLLAESAADLLIRAEPMRIKKCRNPACILVFYDSTKNRGRNWCSMSLCGNRMKVAAHYRRQRGRRKG